MGIRRAIDFRFPEREQSFTQGGSHLSVADDTWQTVVDISGRRGTMYVRHTELFGANYFVHIRVTIDGVANVIRDGAKASGLDAWWIFDFNESVKVEHKGIVATVSFVEFAYHHYIP